VTVPAAHPVFVTYGYRPVAVGPHRVGFGVAAEQLAHRPTPFAVGATGAASWPTVRSRSDRNLGARFQRVPAADPFRTRPVDKRDVLVNVPQSTGDRAES
jgi:hypothetical protein